MLSVNHVVSTAKDEERGREEILLISLTFAHELIRTRIHLTHPFTRTHVYTRIPAHDYTLTGVVLNANGATVGDLMGDGAVLGV